MFHVEWCIRQLWCSSITSCNTTIIAHNQRTDIYSQTSIFISYAEEKQRISSMEGEVLPLKSQLLELQAQVNQLENTNLGALSANESLQADAVAKLQRISDSYKASADALKKRLKGDLLREKKRADAYKEKALEAHARAKGGQ